jgi:hypothetical protein
MQEAVTLFQSRISKQERTFVVIDALDEFTFPDDIKGLLSYLRSPALAINLLVTSRPHLQIEQLFEHATRVSLLNSRDMNIRALVAREFYRYNPDMELSYGRIKPIIDRIVEISHGW